MNNEKNVREHFCHATLKSELSVSIIFWEHFKLKDNEMWLLLKYT